MATIGAPQPRTDAPRTATDFVGLAELRARAGTEKAGANGEVTREAARQFEAIFVQMMLQSMRQASDAFGTGEDTTYRDMFDQQIALEMTRGKGLGLADVLVRQLAPPGEAGAGLREPTAADFVAARQAAAPSMPAARVALQSHGADALLESVASPSLAPEAQPAASTARSWSDWKPATPEDFIRDVWPHAQAAGAELGVDPRAIVAQAALETGWGRNMARDSQGVSGNNLFNIKADARWSGDRVSVRTLEYTDGMPRQTVAAFRAYPDLKSAFDDYVSFLKGNPRYSEALRSGARPESFAQSLQAAGYATDPSYADKLRSILASPRLNAVVGSLKNFVRVPTP